jgi:hypothetical protein
MMSGPDPGALPMMSRIGLSGYGGAAAYAADPAKTSGMTITTSSLCVRMFILLRFVFESSLASDTARRDGAPAAERSV